MLQCTLTFSDFDPSGAATVLFVAEPHGIGRIPLRDMDLVGDVASYTVEATEFEPGYLRQPGAGDQGWRDRVQ